MTAFNTLLLLALLALGSVQALTLEEALQSADARPDAVTQNLELLNARNDLIRVQGDPLALRLERTQAEQAVALNRAELEEAYYSAVLEITQAYTGVLQGREQLELAQKGMSVSQAALDIAQIRANNGSATQLDVQEAQVALNDAEKNLTAAQNGLNVSENNLEGMIGQEVTASDLEPVDDSYLTALPSLDQALEAAQDHPQLLQSRQGLDLARIGLDLLDPSYASASQIESSRTQLETTQELVQEAQRGFSLQVRNLFIQAENAQETFQVERDSLVNARERLAFQQDRLESGLIAQIELDRAELEFLQTQLAVLQARHGYLVALQQLQEGALISLEGPPAYNFETAVDPVTLSDLDDSQETEQATPAEDTDETDASETGAGETDESSGGAETGDTETEDADEN